MLAVLAGLVLLAVLPASIRPPTRLLLAWDLTALIYVATALWMIAHSDVETCRARASLYDVADWIIMLLVVTAALASMASIFIELATVKSLHEVRGVSLAITGATIALSWAFTHVIFALHYANLYYRPDVLGTPGGLIFPGDRPPAYGDFLYYAFVVGCTAQTADVNTASPPMRRTTMVHGIISFAFNTAILALTINIGAGLLL